METQAMLDNGATKSIISEKLVPKEFLQKLNYNLNLHQYNNDIIQITHCIQNTYNN